MKSLRVILLLLYTQYFAAYGQVFQHISEKEGAPKTTIMGMTQDKDGFMWFASSVGLYRYDSRLFKSYKLDPNNPKSIGSNYITSVLADSRGTLWVGAYNGLNRYETKDDSFTKFHHDPKVSSSLVSERVLCLAEDRQKKVWVGTDKGISCIEEGKGEIRFKSFLNKKSGLSVGAVQSISVGRNNEIWLATNGGLVRIENGKVKVFKPQPDNRFAAIEDFRSVYADAFGDVWLGITRGGLMRFNIASQSFQFLEDFRDKMGELPLVKAFQPDENGNMWIATWSGLVNYAPKAKKAEWYLSNPLDEHSIAENTLMSLFKDRQGGVWIGNYYLGIDYLNRQSPRFLQSPLAVASNSNYNYLESWAGITPNQKLWQIPLDRTHILFVDKEGNKLSKYKLDLSFCKLANWFYVDRNDILWTGEDGILYSYDFKSGKHQGYPLPSFNGKPRHTSSVYRIIEGQNDKLWICGMSGAWSFDMREKTFHKTGIDGLVYSVFQDSKGNVWMGGINITWLIRKGEGVPERMLVNPNFTTQSVEMRQVWRIAEDFKGRIWLVSFEGLRLYDVKKRKFLQYTKGLPDNLSLNDIQCDRNGFLWLTSEFDLIRYHPEKGSIQRFSVNDGIPKKAIMTLNTAFSDADGLMYFNTSRELFSFDPEKVAADHRPTSVLITGLHLFNEVVDVNHRSGVLTTDISKEKQLVFHHDQNIFTLDFALLSYKRSDRNLYRYKLEGFDKGWNQVSVPSATYMNLPSGDYIFRVQAANGDGFWMEQSKELKIQVLPPWWKTWYAFCAYLLLAVLVIYLLARFFWLRATLKKEGELYLAKLDFFTNLSHEVRTHLSLIVGPLEKAYSLVPGSTEVKDYLRFARNNSDKLMQLINELLDFRKIQNGNTRLQVREYDLVKVLKNILSSFEHLAKEKDISVNLSSSDNEVVVWFDLLQMQKVFFNLLSNAFKFTDQGGTITLDIIALSNEVVIKVADNGKGIPSVDIPHLFENFFQTNDQSSTSPVGYGIGLALSRSIVDLHRGQLSVESRLREGERAGETVFSVRLLKGNRHFSVDQFGRIEEVSPNVFMVSEEDKNEFATSDGLQQKYTLLLVEDNDELRAFEKEIFSESYHVIEASNGKEALEMAYEHIPDLILCDVMMPEINGIEVCKELKADLRTSHIPVILLTARSAVSQVMEGLSVHADDYLVKPFDTNVLMLKVGNLIKGRESLKQHYQRSLLMDTPQATGIPDVNSEFLEKLRGLIVQNVADADFGVNQMAFQVGMSVSVLYRKLRSLTGMTVNDFIKTVKMKRAFQLIESGQFNVNEVALMIGYEDTRYFSKEFKKIYGKNPSEIKNHLAQ